jgi:hypothetical protein
MSTVLLAIHAEPLPQEPHKKSPSLNQTQSPVRGLRRARAEVVGMDTRINERRDAWMGYVRQEVTRCGGSAQSGESVDVLPISLF